MSDMKKIPFEVKAMEKTSSKAEVVENAARADKGIALLSPSGKAFLISVDDDGALTSQEITE